MTLSGTASITTFHVDTNRSGLNDQETVLTTANVAPETFGKLFSCPVDGYVYGAPLILSNQTINGAKHNVLFVATENDSVYAYDADTCGGGTPLWKVSLLQSGETPLADAAILPYAGVTSTPVIDPSIRDTLRGFDGGVESSGGTFRLSALNVDTGAQKFGGPVDHQCFSSSHQFGLGQRSADAGYIVPATRRLIAGQWQCVHRLRRLP